MSDSVSRRDLFRRLIPKAAKVVVETVESKLPSMHPPQRRPPGARSESLFLSLCTRCHKCYDACPHAAIHLFPEDTGELAGTPVMVPDSRACHLCEDYPCATSCPEEALIMPGERLWPLGKVVLNEEHCFAFKGPECGACVGLCPPGAEAALKQIRWKPVFEAEPCVGCGLCIEACPTMPKAIELVPLTEEGNG